MEKVAILELVAAWGGTLYAGTHTKCNMHSCEILVDRKCMAHFVRSQVTEQRVGKTYMFEIEAA